MPNLTNGISGQELINEVNHSIDERGKNGVEGAAQEINSDLKINGNIYLGKEESVIPNLKDSENGSNYITEEKWNQLISSDINLARNEDGSVYSETCAYDHIDFTNDQGYSAGTLNLDINKNFSIKNQIVNLPRTYLDKIAFPNGLYFKVSKRTSGSKLLKGTASITMKKDNEIFYTDEDTIEKTIDGSTNTLITFLSNETEIPIDNINGEYNINIIINLTSDSTSTFDWDFYNSSNNPKIYYRATLGKRILTP